jgi:hypothetical protein
MFQKMDLFPFSGEGRETLTLLGPLERANLNPIIQRLRLALSKGPIRVGISLLSPEDGNIQIPKRCVFWYIEFQTKDKSPQTQCD